MAEGKKLQGKVAVITGGTTGIGFATAKLFVEEGAYVFITGRRAKELNEAVKAIGTNVTGVQGDVSKVDDLDRLYETVKAKGRIDIVFANAGISGFLPLDAVTEEFYDNYPTRMSKERFSQSKRHYRYLLLRLAAQLAVSMPCVAQFRDPLHSSTNCFAVARPIPELPPVTSDLPTQFAHNFISPCRRRLPSVPSSGKLNSALRPAGLTKAVSGIIK